ncbi:rod shape-determining protein RodA [Candidatus Giovannonibacteria bacterium]|nr:rod shape-determining protein RodA [Candidatus Giovannonibacteria bacterium]
MIAKFIRSIDWVLVISALLLVFLGLSTMKSFGPNAYLTDLLNATDYFFYRQIYWLLISIALFFTTAWINWHFLKTNSIFLLLPYLFVVVLLVFLLARGSAVRGAASWLTVFSLRIEPVEILKLILILVLAKYFSRRHIEIARFHTLLISGLYVALPMLLVIMQPDLGSAIVLGAIWLGMSLVGGIKVRHLFMLGIFALLFFIIAWTFFLYPYQKSRIISFVSPEADLKGSGYHAFQSMIAAGSGQILGKGIGFGTQSRLAFLPEHETDFIFAAYAEEWGFVGVLAVFLFFGIVLWRILRSGIYGESNFEKLFAAGFAIFLFFQASIHVGMNIGLLPITGLGMPFLSYGGSSLASIFIGLGILESFSFHKKGIFLGSEERFKEGIFGT